MTLLALAAQLADAVTFLFLLSSPVGVEANPLIAPLPPAGAIALKLGVLSFALLVSVIQPNPRVGRLVLATAVVIGLAGAGSNLSAITY